MKIGRYSPDEPNINFKRKGEDLRLHNLLVDLSERAKAGEVLPEIEKEFIYIFLKPRKDQPKPTSAC